jgi:peptidoglycan/LPS O-acetylase OafA/YrhL
MSGARPSGGRDLRLDGIRGIAVLVVLLYHVPTSTRLLPADNRLLPGGWLGVDVFFVLSGYLITRLLLAEQRKTGAIDRKAFYGRRVRRLLPALAVLLALWLLVTQTGLLAVERLRTPPTPATSHLALVPVIGAFGFFYNWVLALGLPAPVGMVHLWSLSVEEQFYLVWPTVVLLATARARRPEFVLWGLVVAGMSVSFLLTAMAVGGHVRDFAYFSSLTSSLGLFVGAATAIARPRHGSGLLGAASVTTLAAFVLLVPDTRPGLLPWTVLVTCVATAVLISGSGPRVDRLLESSWLRYAGRRSYAIYLWSLPLEYALGTWVGISWLMDVELIIGSFLLAELSWRIVERRFLQGRSRSHKAIRSPIASPRSSWRKWPAPASGGSSSAPGSSSAIASAARRPKIGSPSLNNTSAGRS